MDEVYGRLDDFGRHQHGLVTWAQVLEVWPPSTAQRRRAEGLLTEVAPRVFRLAGSPRSWRQRAMAACLAIGDPVAVSGPAAAHLWRAEAIARPPVQVTVPPQRRPRRVPATVRRQPLRPGDVVRMDRIPVTAPARTVLDLSTILDVALLQRVTDDLVRRGHLALPDLERRLRGPVPALRRRVLGPVIDRCLERGAGGSAREDRVVDTLVGAGLPCPERNVIVELGGRLRELDCAYPGPKVAIEYDGWSVHRDRGHFDDDREKAALLQLAGWVVLQVTSAWSDEQLVARVAAALQRPATAQV